jgi:hypothetical protein
VHIKQISNKQAASHSSVNARGELTWNSCAHACYCACIKNNNMTESVMKKPSGMYIIQCASFNLSGRPRCEGDAARALGEIVRSFTTD